MEYRFNTKWHYKAGAVIGEVYCFSRGEMAHASRRIIRHNFLQGFGGGSTISRLAFIGVSSFNMWIWFLRDSPQRYRIIAAISLS
jgi:hypothetical protein